MSGGTWTTQNKVLPGVYIRFKSAAGAGLTVSDRGTVAICEPLSWGPQAVVQTVEAGADWAPFTGYAGAAPQNRFLQEIFKGSNSRRTFFEKILDVLTMTEGGVSDVC